MPQFKAFGMMNLQYEIRICQKNLSNGTMTKTSFPIFPIYQNMFDEFLKRFYEYLNKKLKQRYVICLILKLLAC